MHILKKADVQSAVDAQIVTRPGSESHRPRDTQVCIAPHHVRTPDVQYLAVVLEEHRTLITDTQFLRSLRGQGAPGRHNLQYRQFDARCHQLRLPYRTRKSNASLDDALHWQWRAALRR